MKSVSRCLLLLLVLPLVFLAGCGGLGRDVGGNDPGTPTPTPTPPPKNPNGSIQSVNHIVFMMQENRGFDHYFGKLAEYKRANGYPGTEVDGLPANASIPDANFNPVSPFKMNTVCTENLSPSWLESHYSYNLNNPNSSTPTLDGFAVMAGGFSKNTKGADVRGLRSIGYYDHTQIPYYYFMAANFATSDRFFCPVMSRSQPNRIYLLAATSQGYVYPPTAEITAKNIFQLLQENGITWKVYISYPGQTYLNFFGTFIRQHPDKVVPITQYFTDVANGTLPQVAMIESKYDGPDDPLNAGSGEPLDEHPINNVQKGAAFVKRIVDALMRSPSWKDTVFFLTYDEGGGFWDHVPPQPAVPPDNIQPRDLEPGDPVGVGFARTGYRVPLLVISPFTKKNHVSHTVMDFTAILKFITTRFRLPSLTRRDAAQPDMTEFFDFINVPWETPPTPPAQPTDGPCYFNAIP